MSYDSSLQPVRHLRSNLTQVRTEERTGKSQDNDDNASDPQCPSLPACLRVATMPGRVDDGGADDNVDEPRQAISPPAGAIPYCSDRLVKAMFEVPRPLFCGLLGGSQLSLGEGGAGLIVTSRLFKCRHLRVRLRPDLS